MLLAGWVLAFISAATVAYLAMTTFYSPIRARIQADYLNVDQTLKSIFYTTYDAKLFVILKYGGMAVALMIGALVLNSLVFGVFLAAFLYWIPSFALHRIVFKRREKLDAQVSDVMTALSATVKSGMTLEQSIEEIATKMRPPISEEFTLIKDRIDAGETIVSALKAADERLAAPRLGLVFQSMIVSQQRGGRLATLMDTLSVAIREIERVEERIKTETSGLRLSARIMVLMPILICGLLYIAEPTQVEMLFNTMIGNVILVIAIALDVAAFRMMQKLIDLDV
jgi:tight adherence protein B